MSTENEIKWPKGADFVTMYKKCQTHKDSILNGRILAIDPASNCVGMAYFVNGRFEEAFELKTKPKWSKTQKLREVRMWAEEYSKNCDLVFIEKINKARTVHVTLLHAVGAMWSGIHVPVIEVPIPVWKAVSKFRGETRKDKADYLDALTIGQSAILMMGGSRG